MTIQAVRCPDADAFARATADQVARDPVRMALVAHVAAMPEAWSALLVQQGEPIVAIAHTPPRPILIAASAEPSPDAVAVLADLLRPLQAPGMNVPLAWADPLLVALGRPVHAREHDRLHRLAGRPRLPRPVAGRERWAAAADSDTLRAWRDAFTREALPNEVIPPTSEAQAQALLPNALFWEDGGKPVSTAVRTRPVCGGWSISGVYTPPELRRRGYAGGVVHALARRLMDDGATYAALFTDLSNPTSNKLYAEIGFEPVCDLARIFWSRP